ncbi:MAG: hypothetical protein JNK87_32830 [Bryobacterales bacterium]|nr:hypothetical protein [Bryobacterales bacterium]
MMYKTALTLLFASAGLFAQDQQQHYFPLDIGNQWVYRSAGRAPAESWVVEVTGTREVNGARYFQVTGFPGGPLLMRYRENNVLVFLRRDEGQERTWLPFNAAVGEAFATGIDECNPTAVIRSRRATVRSPLGEFTDGLEVGYAPGQCADAGLTQETYLPGIGLAERRSTSFTGERVMQLVYARLSGGYVEVGAAETGFTVATDRLVYAPGAIATVRMTLRNTQDQPLVLTFPSGQDYDVQIRDGKGEIVYTWSANRAFPLIYRGEVLIQGTKQWLAIVDLPQLAPGDYSLTGFLATTQKVEATIPIRVERPTPAAPTVQNRR